jgi:hypothetical protein
LQLQIFSKFQDGSDKDSHDGKGSRFAPPKSSLDNLNEHATWKKGGSKFSFKADEQEICLLGSSENKVQGLSGNDIGESEEDLLSDEVQGSQSNAKQQLGMVKCSQPFLLKHSLMHHMDVDVVDILGKGRNRDQIKDPIVSDLLGGTMDQKGLEDGSRGEANV